MANEADELEAAYEAARQLDQALRDPETRAAAEQVAAENPDLAELREVLFPSDEAAQEVTELMRDFEPTIRRP